MPGTSAAVLLAAALALAPCQAAGQDQEKVDPARKAGVYAEAGKQVTELKVFAETREAGSTPVDTWGSAGGGRAPAPQDVARIAEGKAGLATIPYLPEVSAFLVNMQGPYADAAVAGTAMSFSVGDNIPGRPQPINHPMTCKVQKVGVTLWRVTSAELDRGWLRKTYDQDSQKLSQADARAYVAILVRDNTGKPPQIYMLQVFPAPGVKK
jgi:hypothetical protein